jgi:signal transduction histidine kinase
VRHANPTLVAVTLRWDAPNLVLRVKDNGSGISATQFEKSAGFGLGNMRERASEIDGRFEIQTADGHGTTMIVTVPISSSQLAQRGDGRDRIRLISPSSQILPSPDLFRATSNRNERATRHEA